MGDRHLAIGDRHGRFNLSLLSRTAARIDWHPSQGARRRRDAEEVEA